MGYRGIFMQIYGVKTLPNFRVGQGNITLCNNFFSTVFVENSVENVNKSRCKHGFSTRLPS